MILLPTYSAVLLQIDMNALKTCFPPANEIAMEVIIRSFTYDNNNYFYKVQRTSCPVYLNHAARGADLAAER